MPVLLLLLACLRPIALATAAQAPAASAPTNAEALYRVLGRVGLDPAKVYQIRDASIERQGVHLSFEDGTIAFTQDIFGKATGAFFEGEGEVLVVPPDRAERESLGLFTGAAVMEEKFTSAYLRFNDDLFGELEPGLRTMADKQEFFSAHDATTRSLSESDALRLLVTFSRLLPTRQSSGAAPAFRGDDRFLHARLSIPGRGLIDLYFDSVAKEQVSLGQLTHVPQGDFFDIWSSFAPRSSRAQPAIENQVEISRYRIRTRVVPPTELSAEAVLDLTLRGSGERTLLFELSRSLQLQQVEADGRPVEFIHNLSLEGTQLARRGNDVVAVVFPEALAAGQHKRLRFTYSGSVLSEAGGGLLYVGARGTWYPNRGMGMSEFDLEFRYPAGWMLLATGKRVALAAVEERAGNAPGAPAMPAGEQVARWVSERPIPLAGFNLGRYVAASAKTGKVKVESYAAAGVEHTFPRPQPQFAIEISPPESRALLHEGPPAVPRTPSPARNASAVAEKSARAIEFFSARFGPFPYSNLQLTQMPGAASQGWPGLVFLSSLAFLTNEERHDLHFAPLPNVLFGGLMQAHETAHQWWGDLVIWGSYRDQWITEALANYSALMMLEQQAPADFSLVMEHYRNELLEKNKNGLQLREAGPVTLGARLSSSRFPDGYEAIAYGRGTWLLHMLRHMLNDVSRTKLAARTQNPGEEPFIVALRKLQQRYAGREMNVRDLQKTIEEDLPTSLWFEGRKSLDWFFDGWVNGTAVPRIELTDVKTARKTNAATVTGNLVQESAPGDLVTSVPIYAVTASRGTVLLGRVFADGHTSRFRLSAPADARKILLDPYHTVLTQSR